MQFFWHSFFASICVEVKNFLNQGLSKLNCMPNNHLFFLQSINCNCKIKQSFKQVIATVVYKIFVPKSFIQLQKQLHFQFFRKQSLTIVVECLPGKTKKSFHCIRCLDQNFGSHIWSISIFWRLFHFSFFGKFMTKSFSSEFRLGFDCWSQ